MKEIKVKPKKKKAAMKQPETVLVLRTCSPGMKGHGGFQWPTSGPVEAPDWSPKAECGNGLHGWLWGAGDWRLKREEAGAKWVVVEVEKSAIVDLQGKVKFPRGVVRAVCANWQDAMAIIRPKMPMAVGDIASGYSGHAAASGNFGHAAASGNSGHAAASGYSGHAAASGNSGHAAASGNSGHAAASGNSGHAAASGNSGVAFAGIGGMVKAGADGAIACIYRDDANRKRILVGYVGEDGIKSGQWYAVEYRAGVAKFVPTKGCEKCDGAKK